MLDINPPDWNKLNKQKMQKIFERFKEESALIIDIPSQPFRRALMEMTAETNKMQNTIAESNSYYAFGGKTYINQFKELMKKLFNHANEVKKHANEYYVGSGGVAVSNLLPFT